MCADKWERSSISGLLALSLCLVVLPGSIQAQDWKDGFDFSAAGVVAYWPLDTSGTDVTLSGFDATPHGDVTFEPIGCGSAALFDGSGDYLEISGHVPYDDEFSACGWIRVDGPAENDYSYIFIKTANVNNAYQSIGYVHDASTQLLHVDVSDFADPWFVRYNTTLEIGGWYHVCTTATSGDVRLYLDGSLVSQAALTGQLDHGSFTGNYIGGFPQKLFGPYSHNGFIDEVVVFDRVLSEEEVQLLGTDEDGDCVADFWVPPPQCSYGPETQPMLVERTTGRPRFEEHSWESCGGAGTVEVSGTSTAALVYLNGSLILGPSDFPLPGGHISIPILLVEGENVLSVQLRGAPGASLDLSFSE